MKRLSLSYRSCPEVAGMFPGHPRLCTVPAVWWDPVLPRGREPLAFPVAGTGRATGPGLPTRCLLSGDGAH